MNAVQEFETDKLIIGTVRNGIYIVSVEGEILLHLEKSDGLLDNTVKRVFVDANKNLWLAMDNGGLSYIQIKSNTNYLIDTEGAFGTVFTNQIKDSLLHLGTNQGLFIKNILLPSSKPRLVDKNLGQIWEIEEVDEQILIGSHEGVFSIENKKLKNIHFEAGAWTFRKYPRFKEILYVGFYSGIGVFKKVKGKWKFVEKWQNFGESSRFMEFDRYGQLWVAHPSKGYYIGHFSKFIKPGALRISTTTSRTSIESTSFKNKDGKIVTVVMNKTEGKMRYKLMVGNSEAFLEIEPRAMQTIIY